MGLLSAMFETRVHPKDPALARLWGVGQETAAGVEVTEESALNYSAVYRAVDLLGRHVGMLPLHLMESTGEQTKRKAQGHALYSILYQKPNAEMTAFNWRHVLMTHVLLWGNHFSEIEWGRGGQVLALWPLSPVRMRVARENGRLWYYCTVAAGQPAQRLAAEQILHVRGLSVDGVMGKSVIAGARDDVALGVATREYGGRFFGNDARPGGVLQHPGVLGDEAYGRLQQSWESRHQGLDRSHRIAILEEGLTFKEIGIPPEDAQFLQTRKFQVTEIARWFGVPPHKLMDLERSTFSNIEHQAIEYVQDSLQPWATNLEQCLDTSLLTPAERGRFYTRLALDGLLRGDSQARHGAYQSGVQNGYYSVNDVRRLEDLDPVEGGDVHLVPLNLGALGATTDGGNGTDEERTRVDSRRGGNDRGQEERALRSGGKRRRLQQAHVGVLGDVVARILRREANDVGNAARRLLGKRSVPEFLVWLDEFYEGHQVFAQRHMAPVGQAYGRLIADEAGREVDVAAPDENVGRFVEAYLRVWASRHAAIQADRVRKALESGTEQLEVLEVELEGWREESRGDEISREESVRLNNAVAVMVYGMAGILTKRWLSFGDSCPYCTDLDGRSVGLKLNFLNAGDVFKPEGAASALVPSYGVGHPPAHRECDCMVVAG